MSLSKSTESLRSNTHLDKFPVYESLPAYFELEYPKFTAFLEAYYEYFSDEKSTSYAMKTQIIRDFVEVDEELLRFMSKELLLGRDYFDRFVDKQNAVQVSNLLYRSKGTRYAIQMFFRVFFGFDVELRYGRDEVFLVGDPRKEELYYTAAYRGSHLYPGNRLRFTFDDGDIQVYANTDLPTETERYSLYVEHFNNTRPYAEDQGDYVEEVERIIEYNVYYPMREDIDYIVDFDDNAIVFQPLPDGEEPVRDDPWLNALGKNGYMPEGQTVKIDIKRFSPAHSAIGSEATNKRITNNGFWQLYSIAIKSPVSISKWREPYKDFVHPAGMYLEGEVIVHNSVKVFGDQPSVITEDWVQPAFSEDNILARMQASITELNLDKYAPTKTVGYSQSGFVQNDRTPYRTIKAFDSDGVPFYAEERLDSDRPDAVYRTRINDIKEFSKKGFTLQQLDDQYQRMDRIDTIEPRKFDNVEADLSSTINLFDENQWYGTADVFCLDSDGNTQFTVLGNILDFPPEYQGCPGFHFNLFGLIRPLRGYLSTEGTPAGNNFNLVAGVAQQSRTAYRDERVWGYTNFPGGNFAPGQTTSYTDNIDSFGNPISNSSRWDNAEDYANPFDYAITNGTAQVIIGYFRSGFIVDAGAPGYGDSDDYMNDIIQYDSTDGSQYFRAVIQDSV